MEKTPRIEPEDLKVESSTLEFIKGIEERKDKIKEEIELLSYQIINLRKEIDENPGLQSLINELTEKRNYFYDQLELNVAEQINFKEVNKNKGYSAN